jgi:hypothetical protein
MLQIPEFRFRNLNALCGTTNPAEFLPHYSFPIKPGILSHSVYKVYKVYKVRKVNKVLFFLALSTLCCTWCALVVKWFNH